MATTTQQPQLLQGFMGKTKHRKRYSDNSQRHFLLLSSTSKAKIDFIEFLSIKG
ncbi:unnamed protein product, partial [Coccothraustes coccothraustes]